MIPFAQMESDYDTIVSAIDIYETVDDEKLMQASEETGKTLVDFERNLYQDKEVFDAFRQWKYRAQATGEWDELLKEDRIFVNKVLIDFKRSGIDLDDEAKQKIK